jgi:hypothetical protein
MVRLNRYTLPDNVIERMKKLTERSTDINKEIGFKLCADKYNPDIPITTGHTCVGNECTLTPIIEPSYQCPKDKKLIGMFHAHPPVDKAELSDVDEIYVYSEGIGCIGAKKEINCFVRKVREEDVDDLVTMTMFHLESDIGNIRKKRKVFNKYFREI